MSAVAELGETDLAAAGLTLHAAAIPAPDRYLADLMGSVPWRQESIRLFGRAQPMPRLTCWMGDAAYTYSGLTNAPAPWHPAVAKLRDLAARLAGTPFNGVLLNLYRDGRDSMGWHADDEPELGPAPMIASLNLGAARRMRFKPKRPDGGAPFSVTLGHGSVLLMQPAVQTHWLHAIPKTARPVGPRINLTFRRVIG